MIPVELVNVVLSDKGFVILLKSREDNKALPISIGQLEAQSIIIALGDTKPARPLTHDLLKSVLEELEASLVRIEVCDLLDDTFYGKLILDRQGTMLEIDTRPSDAIALALRCDTPIFVADKVLEEAHIILEPEDPLEFSEEPLEEGKEQEMPALDKLKLQLKEAVEAENYEEAARIRDEIKKHTLSN